MIHALWFRRSEPRRQRFPLENSLIKYFLRDTIYCVRLCSLELLRFDPLFGSQPDLVFHILRIVQYFQFRACALMGKVVTISSSSLAIL